MMHHYHCDVHLVEYSYCPSKLQFDDGYGLDLNSCRGLQLVSVFRYFVANLLALKEICRLHFREMDRASDWLSQVMLCCSSFDCVISETSSAVE